MSAGDNVDLRLDTSQLLSSLNAAILKFQDFYDTINASPQSFNKVVVAMRRVSQTLEDQAKLARTGAYALNDTSKAVDGLTKSLSTEALKNEEVSNSLKKIRQDLSAVALAARDVQTATKQAVRLNDPGLLAAATSVKQPVALDQGVVAKYQRNLFRLTGDDISGFGTKAQYTFRQVAKDAGEFAAKAGIPWDTFAKKLKAVQEGDIKIFKPGAQADLQNVLIGLANQYEKLGATKTRLYNQDRKEGLLQVAAQEEQANRNLARLNAERVGQQESIAANKRKISDEIAAYAKRDQLLAQLSRAAISKEEAEIRAYEIDKKRTESKLASDEKTRVNRANYDRAYQFEQRQKLAAQKVSDEIEARATNRTFNAQRDAKAFQVQLQSGVLRQKDLTTQYNAANQKLVETYVTLNRLGQQQVTTLTKQNGALKDFNQTTYDSEKAAKGLLISWQSIIRMFSAQVLQQAMASFIGNITQAVNAARDLQIQIGLIQTLSDAGFSTEEWVKSIKAVSDATGLVAQDVASGLYDTLSNQIADGGKSIEFITGVSKFAVATNSSLKDSVNAVSSAINSYGGTVEDTTRITDVFFKMIDLGRVTADEFANDIGRILPGASQLGVSLEEVSATISVLTNSGVRYNTAATSLFNIFSRLLKPAGGMKDFLESINKSTGKAAISTYGYAQLLGKIAAFTQNKPELLAELFPDVRGLRGVLRLAGDGLDDFYGTVNQMENAAGTVQKAMDIMTASFGKRFQIELERVQNYFTTVWGQKIVESVVKISDAIGGFVRTIKFAVDALTHFGGVAIAAKLASMATRFAETSAAVSAANRVIVPSFNATESAIARTAATTITTRAQLAQWPSAIDTVAVATAKSATTVVASTSLMSSAWTKMSSAWAFSLNALKGTVTRFGAFMAANWPAMIAVGLTAAVVLWKKHYEDLNEMAEKEFERWKKIREQELEASKNLAQQATKGVAESQKILSQGLGLLASDMIGELNKVTEETKKTQERITTSLNESSGAFFNYLGDSVTELGRSVSDAEAEIKRIKKFADTEPANIAAKQRKVKLDEAETDPEKYALLERELLLERAALFASKTREEELSHYENMLTITGQMVKVEKDNKKEAAKAEKQRLKDLQERKKLERELGDDTKKLELAKLEMKNKLNAAAKKGTVTTRNGDLIPSGDSQELIAGKNDYKVEQIQQSIQDKMKRIAELNKNIRDGKIDIIKAARDENQLYDDAFKLQTAADELRAQADAEQVKRDTEKKTALENDLRLMRQYFSALESLKFDKLVEPGTSKEKFDKILSDGKEALAKYEEDVRKYAGDDFKQKLQLEKDIFEYKKNLAEVEQKAARKLDEERLFQRIEDLKLTQAEDRKVLQTEMEKAREPLNRVQLAIGQKEPTLAALGGVFKTLGSAPESSFKFEALLAKSVQDLVETIRKGNATDATYKLLNSVGSQIYAASIQRKDDPTVSRLLTDLNELVNSVLSTETDFKAGNAAVAEVNTKIADTQSEIDKTVAEISKIFGTDVAERVKTNMKIAETAKNTETSANILTDIKTILSGLSPNRQNVTSERQITGADIAVIEPTQVNPKLLAAQEQQRITVDANTKALEELYKRLPGFQNQLGPIAPITKAMGGMIHGSDNIPALLSKGEFVVNAGATRRFYSQLVAMNGVRGYERGGLVSNNVGDIHLSMQSSGNVQSDIVAIGKGIQREIRRGRLKF